MATIQGVYVALFGRPADPAGLTYFNSVTKSGADLSGIGDLASTQEYKDRFAGQNNTQIVNAIYQSLFGRDAEAAGLNFFVDALNKGTMNIKNIAINILDGAQGSDKTTVTNKIAAADLYTKSLDTAAEIGSYVGNAAAAQGRAFISGVTTTVPTQAAVDAAILTMQAAGAAGNTITATANIVTLDMTTGVGAAGDVKTTTNNNDTINASTFLTATSKIDGGLGVDTVNASVSANLAIGTDGLKNIEIFNVKATAASTVDLTNASGLQQAWNDNSTKALTFDKIAASTTVGLKGTIADATTFAYANTAGTNTANVSLDSAAVTAGKAVTIASTEIVNIANSGTSSVDSLTLDAGQTVNISGSGTLSLGIVSTTVETVSASAFTGKLTYDATNNTAIKAVAGGAGADTLTISTVHSNDVTVNGGAGTDTITVSNNGVATKAIVLTGGADADQFVFGTGVGNVQAVDTNANFVKTLITVSDFTASADAIKVAVGGASPRDVILAAEQAQITGSADLLSAAQKAASYTDVNKASVFTYGGDAYILVQNGTAALDAGDTFIKVTGVTDVATFTSANFQIS